MHPMRRTSKYALLGFVVATFVSSALTAGSPVILVVSITAVGVLSALFVGGDLRRGFVWGWLAGLVLSLFGTSFYITQAYGPARSYETSERNSQLFDTLSGYTIPGGVVLCALCLLYTSDAADE